MRLERKVARIGTIFLTILFVSGLALLYRGNDATVLAIKQKDGILTAEQVKMSFDSVSGRLIREAVKEGNFVKKGDVVMELDSTDTDLSIARLKTQIAQLEAQIESTINSQEISFMKVETDAGQNYRQIDQQQAAIISAEATLKNAVLDYDRKQEMFTAGAISKSILDDAEMALNVARANVAQQEELLQRLRVATNGTTEDTIYQARRTAENMTNEIESLRQQKAGLEVQLQELEVAKGRLTLRAPEDGKILKILAKQGEMVSPSTPVILLESTRRYYDIYINENQAINLHEGDTITGTTAAGNIKVDGTIRLLTKAASFADLKQTREKGQADLSAFQVRIYVEPQEGVLTGMTIGVTDDEFDKR